MQQIEITGKKCDSIYIELRELRWGRLKPVGEKCQTVKKSPRTTCPRIDFNPRTGVI